MATNDKIADSGDIDGAPEFGPESEAEPPTTSDTDTEPSGPSETTLPLDQVFEVLKNERRRMVLQYLHSHDDPLSIGELAEHVAARENDTTVTQISSRERKCAYVGLYQCHLPKMDDMNVIDFDQNRGKIQAGRNVDQVLEYLDWSTDQERPWPVYYLALASAGLALVLTTGLLSTGVLAPGAAVASLVAVTVVALAQHRSES